jgi:oxygen-dependent protoporphyrinogen oxidase
VAVIGGGIAGLAAAHRVRELDATAQVTLFEASSRLGGVIQTERADGYLLEYGADNFITNLPWGVDLCRRIGLADRLLPTNASKRRALIVRQGKLHPVPEGFLLMAPGKMGPLLTTSLLSWRGKLRMLAECLIGRRYTAGDESVAAFARRRLGREAYERLVQPLVGGIYTADAERLSLAATMPRFRQMEEHHGSLTRGAWRERKNAAADGASGARYGLFVAPEQGMGELIAAIAAKLPEGCVRLNTPIQRLEQQTDRSWRLHRSSGEPETFDAVIVALPAYAAARLLSDVDAIAAAELQAIEYAGSVLALAGYAREQITRGLDGFGFVVPEVEHREILAASYTSEKFPGRAPPGHVLIRVFLGGHARPEQLELSDEQIGEIVARELGELLGTNGEPGLFRVVRWPRAMPQYHLGHVERVATIRRRAAALGHLALCGSAYDGVGIPQCIRSGEQAAERAISAA